MGWARALPEDPRIPLDNNAERGLRTMAIGRQNWPFAGSDEGGRGAATLYSPIGWVRRHGLDP